VLEALGGPSPGFEENSGFVHTPYDKKVAAFARFTRSGEHGAERRAGNLKTLGANETPIGPTGLMMSALVNRSRR
jgi:hypothetical protein